MGMQAVADALARLEKVLRRKPEAGLSDDAPASARWAGPDNPLRVACRHPAGHEVLTDMPVELAGKGDQPTPGWLYRAGMAACATTSIALLAAAEGVELTSLQVDATSASDARGLVGLRDERDVEISPAPRAQALRVRIAAAGTPHAQLQALVQRALQRSPIPRAVMAAGLDVRVEAA